MQSSRPVQTMDLVLVYVFFYDNEVFYTTSLKQLIQQISLWSLNFYLFNFLTWQICVDLCWSKSSCLIIALLFFYHFQYVQFLFQSHVHCTCALIPEFSKCSFCSFDIQLWCHITDSQALYYCISDSQVSNLLQNLQLFVLFVFVWGFCVCLFVFKC